MKPSAQKQGMRSAGILLWSCLVVALTARLGVAQSQPSGETKTEESSQPVSADKGKGHAESKPAASDSTAKGVITVRDSEGKTQPLPGVTWPEIEAFLRNRLSPQRPARPDFNVWLVALSGKTDDNLTHLTATINIKVNCQDTWVAVPLGLNEAALEGEPTYRGAGQSSPGRNDRLDPKTGYVWWFKGEGQHELVLPLLLTVRKTAPSRRLQLSIPATTASSRLKLQLPLPPDQLKVTPPKNSQMEVRAAGQNGSEIELHGFNEGLDLQWRRLPKLKPTETALDASTRIEVDLSSEPAVVVAEQTIRALQGQGSFDSVQVRLPGGFGPPNIEGEQYSSHETSKEDPQRVTVRLTEQTTGPIRLRWTLEAAETPSGRIPPLEGFDVEHARWQRGDIDILTAGGYRISEREGKNVYRRSVKGGTQNSQVASAYRFHKQPFRLVLDVHEIEPYFTVEPHLLLRMSAEQADLEAAFWLEVYHNRGAVRDVELNWPNWKSQGWVIDRSPAPGLVEDVQIDPAGGSIRVRFVQRMTGRFKLPFRARRPIQPGDKRFDLSLPSAVAPNRLPSVLVLLKSDNIEADLLPTGETSTRSLSRALRNRVEIPDEWRDLRRSEWRVDSQTLAFSGEATIHAQEINTSAAAKLRELKDGRLWVSQRITYNVRFERLSQIRLLIPKELKGRVEFFSSDGSSLSPDSTGTTVGSLEQTRFRLTEDRIGSFDIQALFDVDLGEELLPGTVLSTKIPLIQSSDAKYSSLRLELENGGQVQMTVTDDDWKQQLSMDGSVAWTTTKEKFNVPLELNYSATRQSQEYVIHKALIRTRFDAEGYARSRAQYQIAGHVATIVVGFPAEIEPAEFFSDGRELEAIPFTEASGGMKQYRLEFSDEADRVARLLTINFHSRVASRFVWSESHRLSGPQFPANVWIEEIRWEVRLPANQHLFTIPQGYSPQFCWQRDGIFWHRSVRPEYADLASWIAAGLVESQESKVQSGESRVANSQLSTLNSQLSTLNSQQFQTDLVGGNVYQFSRFGPSDSLTFYSMSRSLVLLFGAGLALLVGFLLLKIPTTRNVLTILLIVFVLSVVGLWHSQAVGLLLQPAILGLLLAVVAVVIDGAVKRKRSPSILTLSSPSDFISPASTESAIDHAALISVGSEQPTAVRPTQPPPSKPAPSSSVTGTNA